MSLVFLATGALSACGVAPASSPTATTSAATTATVGLSVAATELTHIAPQVSAAVGGGGLAEPLDALPASMAPLRDVGGRLIILYIGAEYCPYCAAERWSLIAALSRFGTFASLPPLVSSDTEFDLSSLQTFTFHGSSYTSAYLNFQSVELKDRNQGDLERMTDQQSRIFNLLDYPPYVDSVASGGGIPFVDLASRYAVHYAGYPPQVLTGLTRDQIAGALGDPSNRVTRAIVGNANYLTAAICRAISGQPASVCAAAPIPTLQAQLPAAR